MSDNQNFPHRSYHYIDNTAKLEELLKHIVNSDTIAIDTEADSYHHYFPKVCLIQMTFDGTNYIVDPLAGIDCTPLMDILAEKTLILHDAGYDLRMMKSTFNFKIKRDIFDTMQAAQLVGCRKLGLVALIEQYFGIKMSKRGQRSDWSRRPLRKTQLQYAVDDTRYLHRLVEKLHKQLQMKGRLEWHRQTCENTVRSVENQKSQTDNNDLWRIKGTSLLTPHEMTFVRELWYWREKESQKADLPPFRIMSNQKIIDLASAASKNKNIDLEKAVKLPVSCTGKRLEKLKTALHKATLIQPENFCQPKKQNPGKKLSTDVKHLAGTLRAEYAKIAASLELPSHLLAPRAAAVNIALKRAVNVEQISKAGPLMIWQAELLTDVTQKVINSYTEKSHPAS